ncbi:hypothetical protein A2U01_0070140, partial [Trifolium medium]|nr:hypothetical protein [Trifolium medium]
KPGGIVALLDEAW